jgi:photoactive yellow protein
MITVDWQTLNTAKVSGTLHDWTEAELAPQLDSMTAPALDRLAYGAVLLDRQGTILRCNRQAGHWLGSAPEVLCGRNLFSAVAPSLQSLRVYFPATRTAPRFAALQVEHEYALPPETKPLRVRVHLRRAAGCDNTWLLLRLL